MYSCSTATCSDSYGGVSQAPHICVITSYCAPPAGLFELIELQRYLVLTDRVAPCTICRCRTNCKNGSTRRALVMSYTHSFARGASLNAVAQTSSLYLDNLVATRHPKSRLGPQQKRGTDGRKKVAYGLGYVLGCG